MLVVKGNPVLDKRIHVFGQLPNGGDTPGPGKFAECEDERDPLPDAPVLVVVLGQPNNVRLDLHAHP